MDKKLREQISLAFYAPEPAGKEAFLKKLRPREITVAGMLIQQVPYIRKHVWIFAAVILTAALAGALWLNTNTERLVEALAPLAAASASLEVHRSWRYKMSEFEMAARFSMRSVLYSRLLIIGSVYTAVFCIIAPVLSVRFGYSFAIMSFRILIPYLGTTSLCLHIERTKTGRSNSYLSAAVAVVIAAATLWLRSYELENVAMILREWGAAILIALVILTIYENYKTVNMKGEFAWK